MRWMLEVSPALVRNGARMAVTGTWRRVRRRRYDGNAAEICEQVVRDCFDPKRGYLRTSADTYTEVWARDFGRVAPALIETGFADEVEQTYAYALAAYARAGRFALVVDARGQLYDFPPGCQSPDGLAYFLRGLAALGSHVLLARYRGLLQREVARFVCAAVDPLTGLLRRGLHVSEAQDYAVRDCSCYSCCMLYLIRSSLDELGLTNPLSRFDYTRLIPETFLRGDVFLDDLGTSGAYIGTDSCLAPFAVGLLEDDRGQGIFSRVLRRLDKEMLNQPLPSRYGRGAHAERQMLLLERWNHWQTDAVWTCLGLELLGILRRLDPPRYARELSSFARTVERLRCFPEVLDPRTGELLHTPLYVSETSMLWAGSLLAMLRRAV